MDLMTGQRIGDASDRVCEECIPSYIYYICKSSGINQHCLHLVCYIVPGSVKISR